MSYYSHVDQKLAKHNSAIEKLIDFVSQPVFWDIKDFIENQKSLLAFWQQLFFLCSF